MDGSTAELEAPAPAPLAWEIVRDLTEDDLGLLAQKGEAMPRQGISAIRHAHHQLARLLVQGFEPAEVSLLTGYSPQYIEGLIGDPAFEELLGHYTQERAAAEPQVYDRMRAAGLSALEEIQRRLTEEPEKVPIGVLMDAADKFLAKPAERGLGAPGAPNGGPAGGINIKVNFVQGQGSAAPDSGLEIEGKVL